MKLTYVLISAAFLLASAVAGRAVTLQPDEGASKDVFVYEFDVPGVFGIPTAARMTNLDTETLSQISPPPVPFGNFLGAAETDPFSLTPGGPLRQHGTRSLIQFPVASTGLAAAQVDSAWLYLYALPALSAFESPTADHPVTTDLRRVTAPWNEKTVTWETRPMVESNPSASVMQSGVNQWVRWDVSDLVRAWLADPASNYGMELSQREVVEMEVVGQRDRYFASLYASSANTDPALRPYLEINAIPEPTTAGLAVMAVAAAVRLRRR